MKNFNTKNTYNKIAKEYNKINEKNKTTEKHINEFLKLINGTKIVDMGCGHGRDSKIFSEKGYKQYAYDYSEELIKISKENHPEGYYKLFDMLNDSWDQIEEFDGIWCSASLLHFNKEEFEFVINKIIEKMNEENIFYFSLKVKNKEEEEIIDGRYFYFHEELKLENMIKEKKLKILYKDKNIKENSDELFISYITKKAD